MNKCTSWHEADPAQNYGYSGRCYGTKECDPCKCDGDEAKCDFYPKERQQDMPMLTECKWIIKECAAGNCPSECPYHHETLEKCTEKLLANALNYIENLEFSNMCERVARKAVEEVIPRWISCKDKLPEECDGTVLVCFANVPPYNFKEQYPNAKHDQRVRIAHYSQYSDTWYIGDMCGVGGKRPTHWMPLPVPTDA